jgi:predicted metal-dependent hydrolase
MNTLSEIFQSPVFNWLPPHQLRQSMRAKRLQMRISHRKGLEIILPRRISNNIVMTFVQGKRDWIEKQYQLISALTLNQTHHELPTEIPLRLLDEVWHIKYINNINKKNISFIENIKNIGNPENILSLLGPIDIYDTNNIHNIAHKKIYNLFIKFLKKKAQDILPTQLQKISKETGLAYNKLSIRHQKTLWGSCSIKKNINLSISLLFLPPHLVNYVLIHELCHTVHLNHSIRFWKLVSKFDSDYRQHAAETRRNRLYVPAYFM